MTSILVASIAVHLASLAWSLVLLRRTRDWRLIALCATLALLALGQTLKLARLGDEGRSRALMAGEIPGLAAAVLALLFVAVLDRVLTRSRLYDRVVESAVDAVVRLSPESRVTYLNPAFENLTGWRPEEWVGKPFVDLVQPSDRERAEELFGKVLRGSVLPRPELGLMTRQGDVVIGEFAFTPEIRAGRVTGVLAIARDITEPKNAEADLRRLEKRYRYVFRDAPAMYVLLLVKDDELVIDDCNTTFLDKLGYDRSEVLGRDLTSFYTSKSLAELRNEADFAETAAGRAVAYERQLQTKSGEVVETLLRARPERDREGAVVGTLAMFVDVTESNRTARERDEALSKFESIAHHVTDCFWSTVLEPDGSPKVVYVSPGWNRIWGYEPEDIYDNPNLWLECILPEDRSVAAEAFERAAAEQTTQMAAYRVRSKSGAVRWVEDVMSPILDDGGEVIGLDGIARDITARKEAEEALKRSEEKYRELFEDSLDAIFISTPRGKLLAINRSGLEMFGYDAAEEIEDVSQLYEDSADRQDMLESVAESGQLKDFELRLKKKDGTPLRVLESLRAIRDPGGRIVALQGILRDVSGQRELETQLARSQRMDAIGRLAGGIAHDFNNLLTVIFGYLTLVRDNVGAGEAIDEELEGIEVSCGRAAALVRQLLIFSRQHKLEPTVLDLNQIVEGMLGLLDRSLGEDIDLESHLDDQRLSVRADPSQMEQVLMNLVVNAREAMPDGGTLTLSTTTRTVAETERHLAPGIEPGSFVVLTVSDTGHGMDADTLEHIFEPFFSTKSAAERSGLGLSTTYAIIQQSGGFIGVESEEGRGATFRVFLPPTTEELEVALSATAPVSRGGDETILVVEDEEGLLDLVETVLKQKGYSVIRAQNANVALEVLDDEAQTIDLMLTDMVLPEIGGLELIKQASALRPTTKILAMSGYAGHPAALGDLEFPFLSKPFTPEKLVHRVREVLDLV